MSQANARENARAILADVLGLKGKSNEQGKPRPDDDEDFYLLGGTSLMVAIAVELLRENGCNINLSTFMETGKIGRLLDSLFQKDNGSTLIAQEVDKPKLVTQINRDLDNFEGIHITEYVRNDTQTSQRIYQEALQLVATEFDRTEVLGMAFGILKSDVETTFLTSTRPAANGFLLLATYQPTFSFPLYGSKPDQLLGVLVALPRNKITRMPDNPRSSKLQKYLDFIEDVPHPKCLHSDRALTIMLVAVQSPELDRDFFNYETLVSRWNRLKLHILMRLEQEALIRAKQRKFCIVEAINTSFATKEACVELGYETLNSASVGEFAEKFHIDVDPQYHNHHCHFMIKCLGKSSCTCGQKVN